MLKLTKHENRYKIRQSFSKAMITVRTELVVSPRKQAAIIEGFACEFGYQVRPSKNNIEHLNHDKSKQFFYQTDIIYTMPGKGDEMTCGMMRGRISYVNTI